MSMIFVTWVVFLMMMYPEQLGDDFLTFVSSKTFLGTTGYINEQMLCFLRKHVQKV